MLRVAIIDYGMCNLRSVFRAFEECGADPWIADSPSSLKDASHIVLPGVGSYSDGMKNLVGKGWPEAIKTLVVKEGVPLLGICLGMQLLSTRGFEGGETQGLNLISGDVVRMVPHKGERIPHVGWNEVNVLMETPFFNGISNGSDFYFVHSYRFVPQLPENTVAITPFLDGIVTAVQKLSVFGVQFHPEKSSFLGFRLIKNFLEFRV